MNRLTDEQWLLATRYVNHQTTQQDLVRLQSLWKEFPDLQSALDTMDISGMPATQFDAITAFDKLNRRLKDEGLV